SVLAERAGATDIHDYASRKLLADRGRDGQSHGALEPASYFRSSEYAPGNQQRILRVLHKRARQLGERCCRVRARVHDDHDKYIRSAPSLKPGSDSPRAAVPAPSTFHRQGLPDPLD